MPTPLALKLRPKSIDEVIGQKHLFGEKSVLNLMIKNHALFSLIFFGNPGIGKTSIANALANDLHIPYDIFNAVIDKKEKLIQQIEIAKNSHDGYILIVEEIHRLNKDKQDILLPYVENGTITIFATTTENPYFVVNPAIRSRCHIFELQPLSKEDVYFGLKKHLKKLNLNIQLSDEVIQKIAENTNGDFRSAINVIEVLTKLYQNQTITLDILKNIMQQSYALT